MLRLRGGKVHGSLARAGKVKGQMPKVEAQDKKKGVKGRAKMRCVELFLLLFFGGCGGWQAIGRCSCSAFGWGSMIPQREAGADDHIDLP